MVSLRFTSVELVTRSQLVARQVALARASVETLREDGQSTALVAARSYELLEGS